MPVSAELSWRRLAVALLLLVMLPLALTAAAVSYQRPAATPSPPDYDPLPLAKTPVLTAIQARELARSRRLTRAVPVATTLVRPTFPDPLPTLVLAPRKATYRLAELRRQFPAAFGRAGTATLLRASLEVPRGSRLVLDSTVGELRLASSAKGFVTITSRGGKVSIAGTPTKKLRIRSWDESKGAFDTEVNDGRSFLATLGGRLDISHADVGYLGFGTGTSSGVAWRGEPDVTGGPVRVAHGNVTRSRFHHNWFGAYTFEAEAMRWSKNIFADNSAYGFDPHDLSNDFVVTDNVAHGNGRHGFIFSRGCERNVMRNNVAYDNRGHGFMIDDGRSEDAADAAASRLASNDNVIVGNRAYDNDGSGVAIEGGTGNVVRDNVLERNHIGVRMKDGASGIVEGNQIVDSRLYGVDVLEGAGQVSVTNNRIFGGYAGVSMSEPGGATSVGNTVEGASAPLVIAGRSIRDNTTATGISRFYNWNPMLVLWTSVLGIPFLIVLSRLPRLFRDRPRGRGRGLLRLLSP